MENEENYEPQAPRIKDKTSGQDEGVTIAYLSAGIDLDEPRLGSYYPFSYTGNPVEDAEEDEYLSKCDRYMKVMGEEVEKEQTASSEATLNPYAVDSDNPMDWAKSFLAAAARGPGQINGEWAELEAAQWFAAAMVRTIETEYKIRKELDRKSPLQEVAATVWHLLKTTYVLLTFVGVALLWGAWKAGISCQ